MPVPVQWSLNDATSMINCPWAKTSAFLVKFDSVLLKALQRAVSTPV